MIDVSAILGTDAAAVHLLLMIAVVMVWVMLLLVMLVVMAVGSTVGHAIAVLGQEGDHAVRIVSDAAVVVIGSSGRGCSL